MCKCMTAFNFENKVLHLKDYEIEPKISSKRYYVKC